jgi:hypothetical protein
MKDLSSKELFVRIRQLEAEAAELSTMAERHGQYVVAHELDNAHYEFRKAGNCWNNVIEWL